MSEWKQISFAELGETIRGVSYKPSDLREEPSESAVTLLRSNNIKGGRLNYRDTQFVIKGVVRGNQLLKPSDIAICMSNGNRVLVGKSGQFENRSDSLAYTVGAFCSIFRPNQNYDSNFVRHLFGSDGYQKHLDVILAGSAINNLKGSDIQEIIADCPTSKPEQTKIAEILSTVDRAIEQTEALIAKQQRLKTGLMQDLLTRGIDANGNLRSEQTHSFKDSPLGRIPVEWDPSTLGQLAMFNSGYAFKNQELTEGGWRVVRISNLHKPDFPYWHYEGPIRERWVVRSGDILFSWAGVASSIDCVRYEGEDALLNQHIYNFKFATEDIKTYVFHFLQNYLPKLRTEIEGGAGQLHLTKAKIQSIGIPRLQDDELKRTVSILEAIEATLTRHLHQHAKIRALKTALMQDLLNGRKRVTPLLEADQTSLEP